jgi:hypothetical protein
VGATENYEARCRRHHEVPGRDDQETAKSDNQPVEDTAPPV